MRTLKLLLLSCVVATLCTNCFEDRDDNLVSASEINDFVWKAMNAIYVYKDQIPDLANDRFSNNEDYANYLNSFSSPEDLFESLIYLPDDVDEFSAITPNYFELEQQLQGTSVSNGMAFQLLPTPNGDAPVFGYVRYVMPNTSAEAQGVTRGMVFNTVDGELLSSSNAFDLLFGSNSTYTIGLANYDDNGTPQDINDDVITSGTETITLTKAPYTENPILTSDVITIGTDNIGYLMYNGFRFGNNNLSELNSIFGQFQAAGVTDLVLDLRYNGGGSVATATWLASMIAGQDNVDDVFFTQEWNSQLQAVFEDQNPDALITRFTDEIVKRGSNNQIEFQQSINSLNLGRVYVLTTGSTASASELVINGLRPYMNVIQIGLTTRGKPQASRLVYDSENFSRSGANPGHTYALLPLIYESANAAGVSDYYDGLEPSTGFRMRENYGNLGVLGDPDEPLLATAIANITGVGRTLPDSPTLSPIIEIFDNNFNNPTLNRMFDSGRNLSLIKN